MTVTDPRPELSPVFDLQRYVGRPAVLVDGREIDYAELDDLVAERAELLGSTRRLVLIECANALEPLVTYLAALAGGHPALLVPALSGVAPRAQWDRLLASYDPDVVFWQRSGGWELLEQRVGTRHELHPELALLLGTSGSSGTPKLVRLSHENLRANAQAIAGYLGLDGSARAATTLPMQYCYGLSVINSHLTAGGSLWLTGKSVVDPGFWQEFADAGATSFAGVPYTFGLLEQSGADWTGQPGLRQVTAAGGALEPEKVRNLAVTGERRGFDFYVMYGQTEATARMAYLPPDRATRRPETIGVPIEDGEFTIIGGELTYAGPNVMLGYAESAADLALGRTTYRLHTGDLAVQHDDGLYQITGRCNRLAKLFGTRLDLDFVEKLLTEEGIDSRIVAVGDRLHVHVLEHRHVEPASRLVRSRHCLPRHSVRVHLIGGFPVTGSGKPDYGALSTRHAPIEESTGVAGIYAALFGCEVHPEDTFVGLHGDSLSYVEASVRLERVIGELPGDWPQLSVAELSSRRGHRRRLLASVEMPVVLRALAILLIVGTHTELLHQQGGAHVLLGLVGFNLARFALREPTRTARIAALGRSLRDLLVPTVLWIGGVALVSGKYDWPTALMLNQFVGADRWSDQWQFWFLEIVVWGTAALILLLLVPRLDAFVRRRPFGAALAVLAATSAMRLGVTGIEAGHLETYSLSTAGWFLALGWLVAVARTTFQRRLVSCLVVACVWGFFGEPDRELIIIAGLLALLWIPRITVPRVLVSPIGSVASASYFIYLTHWVVYPPLDADHDFLAAAASVLVGVLGCWVYGTARKLSRGRWRTAPGERSSRSRPRAAVPHR